MVAIVDYGVGNLFSLSSSLKAAGQECFISGNPERIRAAERVILPGVGAFEDAAAKLRESGLDRLIIELAAEGKPILGICLGMQLLFDESHENGRFTGLGLIPGTVRPIADVIPANLKLKIPQIGWNALQFRNPTPIFRYLEEGSFVYFVHSYYADCDAQYITAECEYGAMLTASVQNGNVFGCQFHPEKSGDAGLGILKAFCEPGVRLC